MSNLRARSLSVAGHIELGIFDVEFQGTKRKERG